MVAARIRTHILTTQPSEHKSNALNRSAMSYIYVYICAIGLFPDYSCYIFEVTRSTVNAIISLYISLISSFTVVALYPDLIQHNKIIYNIRYTREKCWLLMLH